MSLTTPKTKAMLQQCMNCGHGGWNCHELKDGLCPSCREYDEEEDEDFEEYEDCPKCGRSYNEIDRDVQWCSKCGYDPEKKEFLKSVEPTRADYEEGEADILTGRWY